MGVIRKLKMERTVYALENVRRQAAMVNFNCGENTELVKNETDLYMKDMVGSIDKIIADIKHEINR